MARSKAKGILKLDDGSVVVVIHGGEPIDGCAPIEVLIHASSAVDAIARARNLGVWSPTISTFTRPTAAEAQLATEGRVGWRYWLDGGPWQAESRLERPAV